MKVLVTGATGFIGQVLCETLSNEGYRVILAVRCTSGILNEVVIGNMDDKTDWTTAIRYMKVLQYSYV